jgi:hypothetical protein
MNLCSINRDKFKSNIHLSENSVAMIETWAKELVMWSRVGKEISIQAGKIFAAGNSQGCRRRICERILDFPSV